MFIHFWASHFIFLERISWNRINCIPDCNKIYFQDFIWKIFNISTRLYLFFSIDTFHFIIFLRRIFASSWLQSILNQTPNFIFPKNHYELKITLNFLPYPRQAFIGLRHLWKMKIQLHIFFLLYIFYTNTYKYILCY